MAVPMSPTLSNQEVRLNSALNELDSTLQEAVEQDARFENLQQDWRQQWDLHDEQIADRLRILNEKLPQLKEKGDLQTLPQLKVLS
ncbi:MAG: hypothetical protein P8M30_12045 [Planctomycetaceae bacterium]|jgi:hypothetical protein|nr:hypothetical protein [Planctomycetaceae bacterium]